MDPTHAVDHYLSLGYPIELTPEQDGYFARVPDLPGCESNGITAEDAMDSIQEAMAAWIQAAMETGRTIPLPRREDSDYSGKFVVRVGRSLHRNLVRLATLEGMSLNAFVSAVLSREAGRHVPQLEQSINTAESITLR